MQDVEQGTPISRGWIGASPRGQRLWDKEDVAVKIVLSGECSSHHCYSHSGVTRGPLSPCGLDRYLAIAEYRRQHNMVPGTSRNGFQPRFCFVMAYTLHPGYDGPLWVSQSYL